MDVVRGWINAVIPIDCTGYYSVIGGWAATWQVMIDRVQISHPIGYFSAFISDGVSTEIRFILFSLFTAVIIYAGVFVTVWERDSSL